MLIKDIKFIKIFLINNLLTFIQALTNIMLIWIVYNQTNSAIYISIAVIMLELPGIVFSPFLGATIDRYSTKKTLLVSTIIKSIVFILLGVSIIFKMKVIILMLLFCNSLIAPIFSNGINILIKELFNEEKLVKVNSIMTISFDLAYILGGLGAAFLLKINKNDKVFYGISIILLIVYLILKTIKVDKEIIKNNVDNILSHTITSIKYIYHNRELLNIILVSFFWNIFVWGGIIIILPVFSNNIDNTGSLYGLMNTFQSIGIIIGSLLTGYIILKRNKQNIIYFGIAIQAFLLIIFSIQTNKNYILLLLMLAGIIAAPCMIYKTTYLQEKIDIDKQGTIMAFTGTLMTVGYTLGNFITGIIISKSLTYKNVIISYMIILISITVLLFLFQIKKNK